MTHEHKPYKYRGAYTRYCRCGAVLYDKWDGTFEVLSKYELFRMVSVPHEEYDPFLKEWGNTNEYHFILGGKDVHIGKYDYGDRINAPCIGRGDGLDCQFGMGVLVFFSFDGKIRDLNFDEVDDIQKAFRCRFCGGAERKRRAPILFGENASLEEMRAALQYNKALCMEDMEMAKRKHGVKHVEVEWEE